VISRSLLAKYYPPACEIFLNRKHPPIGLVLNLSYRTILLVIYTGRGFAPQDLDISIKGGADERNPSHNDNSRQRRVMKRLWIIFIAIFALSFAVLGWVGSEIFRQMPPIPREVAATDGKVLISDGEISDGLDADDGRYSLRYRRAGIRLLRTELDPTAPKEGEDNQRRPRSSVARLQCDPAGADKLLPLPMGARTQPLSEHSN
jgi:hypothetical protein